MILITGATGNVGRHLVRSLAEARVPARALTHTEEAASTVRGVGLEACIGSFDDPGSLRRAFDRVSRLFLLTPAGANSMAERQLRVLEAAVAADTVRHIVKVSSITADEPTEASIVAAHRRIEAAIEQSGIAWTHLRPNWFMQNELRQAATISRERVFYAPDVAQVSMADARDVAAVALRVLTSEEHEGRAYTLTGPQVLGYAEVAEIYSSALGSPVRWQEVSLEQARASMLANGLPDELATGFCEIIRRYPKGGAVREVSPVVEQLTRRPPRTFREFVIDHRSAFGGQQ